MVMFFRLLFPLVTRKLPVIFFHLVFPLVTGALPEVPVYARADTYVDDITCDLLSTERQQKPNNDNLHLNVCTTKKQSSCCVQHFNDSNAPLSPHFSPPPHSLSSPLSFLLPPSPLSFSITKELRNSKSCQ